MKTSYLSALAFISTALGQVVLHPNSPTTPTIAASKCLEVRGDGRANGTPVQIFDCNGTPAQVWNLALGPTAVRLNGSNFCLDAGTNPVNGTPMKIWECFAGLPAQSWVSTSDGRIALQNKGLCLDLTNGNLANTNVVQVWECVTGNTNQIWTRG